MPIDLGSQVPLQDCSGVAAMDTFISGSRIYLVVAVFYDQNKGGYNAPSILYEVIPQGTGMPALFKSQLLQTAAANDVLVCTLGYSGHGIVKFLESGSFSFSIFIYF